MNKNTTVLKDLAAIRIIAVISVLVGHACISLKADHWFVPGLTLKSQYLIWEKIAGFVYGYHLTLFVALAGYLYAYGKFKREKEQSSILFFKNKFNRLIVPSLFFGILYCMLLPNDANESFWVSILNGVGHLWFLPMLFMCFVILRQFEWYVIKYPYFILLISLLAYFIHFTGFYVPVIGKMISNTFQFFLFFYIGYLFYFHKRKWEKLKMHSSLVLIFLSVYIISLFIPSPEFHFTNISINKFFQLEIGLLIQLIRAFIGVFTILLFVKFMNDNKWLDWKLINQLNIWSMGIYIFHQFIMRYILFYHTETINNLNADTLPLMLFVVALCLSVLLTLMFGKIRYLRKLI